jgi:NADH-dependent peroxiredoxin subunit C
MEDLDFPMMAKIDTKAPTFNLPYYDPKTDSDGTISSDDMKGKWTVLFYYPADFTFVCPTELKDMENQEAKFKEL